MHSRVNMEPTPIQKHKKASEDNTYQKILSGILWANSFIMGTAGQITIVVLWVIYELNLIVSASFVGEQIYNSKIRNGIDDSDVNPNNFVNEVKLYSSASSAAFIFGVVMCVFASFSCANMIVGLVFVVIEKCRKKSLHDLVDSSIPEKVFAYGLPVITVICTFLQCLCYAGFFLSIACVRIAVFLNYRNFNEFCGDGYKWNNTAPGCGPPSYDTTTHNWAEPKNCCTGDQFCCAFEAPFEFGLKGGGLAFRNLQQQLRENATDPHLTRKEFMIMIFYPNFENRFWIQKTEDDVFFIYEIVIFILNVLCAISVGHLSFRVYQLIRASRGYRKIPESTGMMISYRKNPNSDTYTPEIAAAYDTLGVPQNIRGQTTETARKQVKDMFKDEMRRVHPDHSDDSDANKKTLDLIKSRKRLQKAGLSNIRESRTLRFRLPHELV